MFQAFYNMQAALEQERADHAHTKRMLDTNQLCFNDLATAYTQERDHNRQQLAQLHAQYQASVEVTKSYREKVYELEKKLEATQAALAFAYGQVQDAQWFAMNGF